MKNPCFKIKYGGNGGKQFVVSFEASVLWIESDLHCYNTRRQALKAIDELRDKIRLADPINNIPDKRRKDPLPTYKTDQYINDAHYVINPAGPSNKKYEVCFNLEGLQIKFRTRSYRTRQGADVAIACARRDATNAIIVDETNGKLKLEYA